MTREALSKTTETHKITEKSGIQHEESLLSENAALEVSLNSHIMDLEAELKAARQELGQPPPLTPLTFHLKVQKKDLLAINPSATHLDTLQPFIPFAFGVY